MPSSLYPYTRDTHDPTIGSDTSMIDLHHQALEFIKSLTHGGDNVSDRFNRLDRQLQEMILTELLTSNKNHNNTSEEFGSGGIESVQVERLIVDIPTAKVRYLTHGHEIHGVSFHEFVDSDEHLVSNVCSWDYIAVHQDWSIKRALSYAQWRKRQATERRMNGAVNTHDESEDGDSGINFGNDELLEQGALVSMDSALDSHMIETPMHSALLDRDHYPSAITTILVTDDEQWRILGHIQLLDLLSYGTDSSDIEGPTVRDLMEAVSSVPIHETRTSAALTVLTNRALHTVPVTGVNGELMGVISARRLMEDYIRSQWVNEDGLKDATKRKRADTNAGTSDKQEESFMETGILMLFLKRIVWLILLIFVNLVSSGVIAAFESTLSKNIALAFFIPLLIGTGGNVGTQASTLFIRALALKEVTTENLGRALLRELSVSLCIGITLGIFGSFLGLARGGVSIAIVVALTIVAITMLSDFIGTVLPFFFHGFNLDPAVAAGPVITTILDACGLLIYFGIAVTLLDVLQIGKILGG